jgi:hypothetical protein
MVDNTNTNDFVSSSSGIGIITFLTLLCAALALFAAYMNKKRKQKKQPREARQPKEAEPEAEVKAEAEAEEPTTPTGSKTKINPIFRTSNKQVLSTTRTTPEAEEIKRTAEMLSSYSQAGSRFSVEKLAKPRQSVAFKKLNRSELAKPMDDIFYKKDSHAITINDSITYNSNPIRNRVPSITDHQMYKTNILNKLLNQTEPKKSFGAVSARSGASNRNLVTDTELKTKMVFPTINIPSE